MLRRHLDQLADGEQAWISPLQLRLDEHAALWVDPRTGLHCEPCGLASQRIVLHADGYLVELSEPGAQLLVHSDAPHPDDVPVSVLGRAGEQLDRVPREELARWQSQLTELDAPPPIDGPCALDDLAPGQSATVPSLVCALDEHGDMWVQPVAMPVPGEFCATTVRRDSDGFTATPDPRARYASGSAAKMEAMGMVRCRCTGPVQLKDELPTVADMPPGASGFVNRGHFTVDADHLPWLSAGARYSEHCEPQHFHTVEVHRHRDGLHVYLPRDMYAAGLAAVDERCSEQTHLPVRRVGVASHGTDS